MGLGWKAWTRERLSADEMQGYLQDQVTMVFASAAARDAALPVAVSGMVCYLEDVDRLLIFVAGAWQIVGPLPGRSVTKAGTQSPAAATWVALTWDVAAAPGKAGAGIQVGATPTRLIATAAGRWRSFVGCNGVTQLMIRKNSAGSDSGGTYLGGGAVASAPIYGDAHAHEFTMVAGDYVEAFAQRSSAGTVGTFAGFSALFSLSYLGRS